MTHLLAPAETRYLAVSTLLNPAESISDVQPPVVTAFTLAPLLTNILEICVWPSLALKCSGVQSEVALARDWPRTSGAPPPPAQLLHYHTQR